MHRVFLRRSWKSSGSRRSFLGARRDRFIGFNRHGTPIARKIYEYITTVAGILQMYNWSFIIISAYKILKVRMWDVILGGFGIILLLGAVTGTIMEKSIRPGFVSLILVALVAIVTLIMVKIWNKMQTNTIPNE